MINTTRLSSGAILLALVLLLAVNPARLVAQEPANDASHTQTPTIPGPSFEDVLSLTNIGSVTVSADGASAAYVMTSTDWEENRYTKEVWLARGIDQSDPAKRSTFQLTRSSKGSRAPQFVPATEGSPATRLAFLSDRGDQQQVFVMDTRGGEATAVTTFDGSVSSFQWSPDGSKLAFVASEKETDEHKAREKKYGAFAAEDEELTYSHLWILDLAKSTTPDNWTSNSKPKAQQLTSGDAFTVGSFDWSPDGSLIVFDHRPRPIIDDFVHSDISIVEVASGTVRKLVELDGPDGSPMFSPNGQRVAFTGSFGNNPYFGNSPLATIATDGSAAPVLATADFDENPNGFAWTDDGIWFRASQRTEQTVFRLSVDAQGQPGTLERLELGQPVVGSLDISKRGGQLAFTAQGPERITELYSLDLRKRRGKPAVPIRHTNQHQQVEGWPLGTREIVQWESKDGAEIEGVLLLPENHDRSTPAPLLVVIHGGPTGTSRPTLVSSYVYPVTQWLAKGSIVLMPNYRGSAGYGAAFRALNVGNLGVGDAWDVESGVQHLIDQGLADKDLVGAMGWSQGGYISAFLATTSSMFKALSDGAGISDWMTYYVNTDIHGFTRNYLGDTPWKNPDIYARTSPITYIRRARTPTLIQHGENDGRVPVPNAYELYQGLQDQGVDTRLVIYKGFGHGITKPKERLAAVWHNWQWFAKYLWDEEVELPMADDKDTKEVEEPNEATASLE